MIVYDIAASKSRNIEMPAHFLSLLYLETPEYG
jgi:hypothetical protein